MVRTKKQLASRWLLSSKTMVKRGIFNLSKIRLFVSGFLVLSAITGFSQIIFAQTADGGQTGEAVIRSSEEQSIDENITEEVISSFHADVTVHADATIAVTETIAYNSGGLDKHGIYRDIRLISSQGKRMEVSAQSVKLQSGENHPYTIEYLSSDVLRLKIGDPNVTFVGPRTYQISYTVRRAIGYHSDTDELYWNVTGNEWQFPIEKADAIVTFDTGITPTEASCYFGLFGMNTSCLPDNVRTMQVRGSVQKFTLPEGAILSSSDGLTIAVSFPKGQVASPTGADTWNDLVALAIPWIIGLGLPLMILYFSYRRWNRLGRDPKGTGVIVPQYDVPENVTPMQCGGIVSEEVSSRDFSAEIIYLATKGYLSIRQFQYGFLNLMSDYELKLLKTYGAELTVGDTKLLTGLHLYSAGDTVKLSSLRYEFSSIMPVISAAVYDDLKNQDYYSNPPKGNRVPYLVAVFIAVFVGIFTGAFLTVILMNFYPLPDYSFILVGCGFFISTILLFVFLRLMPAKTEKGIRIKEYLLGLKMYLSVAEKDRINFHNAPEKKPEIFEMFLPYAMIFGVEKSWAKEFEGMYVAPPNWYAGAAMTHFSASSFVSSITSFSTSASSTMSAVRGSSGGGSSGGGGGGGGGGSW